MKSREGTGVPTVPDVSEASTRRGTFGGLYPGVAIALIINGSLLMMGTLLAGFYFPSPCKLQVDSRFFGDGNEPVVAFISWLVGWNWPAVISWMVGFGMVQQAGALRMLSANEAASITTGSSRTSTAPDEPAMGGLTEGERLAGQAGG